MKLKKIIRQIYYLIIVSCLLIISLDCWISYKTLPYIYNNINDLPARPIGVVLGTSKYVRGGGYNEFYRQRILGATELYFANKVNYLLLSGDNSTMNYNEPKTMRKDLLNAQIPASAIFLDYAGFRTLDSIIRANRIFNAQNFTIITQQFHCERAIFIAQYQGILAQCYAVPSPEKMKLIKIRELFARLTAFVDLYILDKGPKFLGPISPIIHDNDRDNDNSVLSIEHH